VNKNNRYTFSPMINWFNPKQLMNTALKVVISGTFASYADKREMQAALDLSKQFEDFNEDEIWIDFVSDTGDGFDSTYTVADLVTQDLKIKLDPENKFTQNMDKEFTLLSGSIAIFGGDQVYPTPSNRNYESRFKIPFSSALIKNCKDNSGKKLFAIPGNHDWYDGLGNFIKIFCQQRKIGNWQTLQHRSYFAIKLPHNYWLWAIDVQLNSDIDKPQLDYFEHIAKNEMKKGDNVILVTAEPSWLYKVIHRNDESYKRLKFFEQEFITKGDKFKLVVTLTGDLHHYSRYEEFKKTDSGETYINHLITAGGGGAFLHPTHNLPEVLTNLNERNDPILKDTQYKDPKLQSCFPTKQTSQGLANRILLFPFRNFAFGFLLCSIQLILAWVLQSKPLSDGNYFMQQLANVNNSSDFFKNLGNSLWLNPPAAIISILVVVGFFLFADNKAGKTFYRCLGALHGGIQLLLMFTYMWFFSWFNFKLWGIKDFWFVFVYFWEVLLIGTVIGGFIMGVYLWFCNRFLNTHIDVSFSSIHNKHYKNFLRMHITKEGFEIYPIGIKRVVTNWIQCDSGESIKFVSDDKPEYYLIEPPIIIKSSYQNNC
jgi:hypothetical protein